MVNTIYSRKQGRIEQKIKIIANQHAGQIEHKLDHIDAAINMIQTVLELDGSNVHDYASWIPDVFQTNKYVSAIFIIPDDGEQLINIRDDSMLFDQSMILADNMIAIDENEAYITYFDPDNDKRAQGLLRIQKIYLKDDVDSEGNYWGIIAIASNFSEIIKEFVLTDDDYEYRIRSLSDVQTVIYSSIENTYSWNKEVELKTNAGVFIFESHIASTALLTKITAYLFLVLMSSAFSLVYFAQHMQIIRKSDYIEELNTKLKELLVTDYLTNTKNKRGVYEFLEAFIPYAKRNKLPFCVAMLDIDNFKEINDKMGHEVGDKALVFFAERFKNRIRESDAIGRFGGDEFICVFTDCDADNAYRISDDFKQQLTKDAFSYKGYNYRISFSMGLTQYKQSDKAGDMIWRADEGLYKAKKAGKNRIMVV